MPTSHGSYDSHMRLKDSRSFRNAPFSFLLLLVLFAGVAAESQDSAPAHKIAVFGSSVARGAGDKTGVGGYAGRLRDLMKGRGWEVVNVSRGGDNTISIQPRFDAELISQKAGYVLIGLSLANEGLAKQPDKAWRDGIYEQWRSGMLGLIARCRAAGMNVVAGNCYAKDVFASDADLYAYTRRMNVEVSRWDVPSVNFLGAIDDGRGAWAEGFFADGGHPNAAGHQEMFLAIVPTLFDALAAGKPLPAKASGSRYLHVGGGLRPTAPVQFTPGDLMHSFAVSLWIRNTAAGVFAVVEATEALPRDEAGAAAPNRPKVAAFGEGEPAEVRLQCTDSALAYVSARGEEVSGALPDGGAWVHVVLSHAFARGETQLFLNGVLAGRVKERLAPKAFFLGGGASSREAAEADFREWAVYRSSLNEGEARFLYEGGLYQSSLEVYAPLVDEVLDAGNPLENRAQSFSEARLVSTEGVSARAE